MILWMQVVGRDWEPKWVGCVTRNDRSEAAVKLRKPLKWRSEVDRHGLFYGYFVDIECYALERRKAKV